MKSENQEEIDNYLQGKLSGEELARFEQRLKEDPAFASEVNDYKKLITEMTQHFRRKDLKQQLNEIHNREINQAEGKKASKAKVVRLYYYTTAVAASVAIFSVFTTLFFTGYFNANKQQAHYKELKRDIDYIKRSQSKIANSINENTVTPKPTPAEGATAFPIGAEGIFLTSYHVVANADSVYVENAEFGKLKVTVAAVDKQNDLAILKADTIPAQLKKNPFRFRLKPADLGERVFTLGYPKEDLVYAEGSVSSRTGYELDTSSCQVSIPVNPGNSGSPVFDENGYIIGMITGKDADAENVSYALESNTIIPILDSNNVKLPAKSSGLNYNNRTTQIRKAEKYIFTIKAFK
ncbi:MAG TPA: serine protease [Cytophagaceae bacterium]